VVRPDGALACVDLGPLAAAEEAIAAWRDLLPKGGRGVGAVVPAVDSVEGALLRAGARIRARSIA